MDLHGVLNGAANLGTAPEWEGFRKAVGWCVGTLGTIKIFTPLLRALVTTSRLLHHAHDDDVIASPDRPVRYSDLYRAALKENLQLQLRLDAAEHERRALVNALNAAGRMTIVSPPGAVATQLPTATPKTTNPEDVYE